MEGNVSDYPEAARPLAEMESKRPFFEVPPWKK